MTCAIRDSGDLEATRSLGLEHADGIVLLRRSTDLGNVVSAETAKWVLF